jgi:hypothetical protein
MPINRPIHPRLSTSLDPCEWFAQVTRGKTRWDLNLWIRFFSVPSLPRLQILRVKSRVTRLPGKMQKTRHLRTCFIAGHQIFQKMRQVQTCFIAGHRKFRFADHPWQVTRDYESPATSDLCDTSHLPQVIRVNTSHGNSDPGDPRIDSWTALIACFNALRWLPQSTLLKLPPFILEGICKKCGLAPTIDSTHMVHQIMQWVRVQGALFCFTSSWPFW